MLWIRAGLGQDPAKLNDQEKQLARLARRVDELNVALVTRRDRMIFSAQM
jgi:hypothetical protein